MTSSDSEVPDISAAELADRFRQSGNTEDTFVRVFDAIGRPFRSATFIIPRMTRPTGILVSSHYDKNPHLPEKRFQWLNSLSAETAVETDAWCLKAAWVYGAHKVFRAVYPSLEKEHLRSSHIQDYVKNLLYKSYFFKESSDPDPRLLHKSLDQHGGVVWDMWMTHFLENPAIKEEEVKRVMFLDRTLKRNGRRDGSPPTKLLPQLMALPRADALLAKPNFKTT